MVILSLNMHHCITVKSITVSLCMCHCAIVHVMESLLVPMCHCACLYHCVYVTVHVAAYYCVTVHVYYVTLCMCYCDTVHVTVFM